MEEILLNWYYYVIRDRESSNKVGIRFTKSQYFRYATRSKHKILCSDHLTVTSSLLSAQSVNSLQYPDTSAEKISHVCTYCTRAGRLFALY